MRLTKKNVEIVIDNGTGYANMYNKLRQLEDAEELCEKIVSQPIYEKNNTTGEIREINYEDYTALYDFKKRRIEIHDWDYVDGFDLDDYGINWALTKEELL